MASLSAVTNISSLIAQRNISRTQTSLLQSVERLSSGLRINSAADDPAGLAISNRLTAQIGSYGQAQRNTNDGISALQTANGAMSQVSGLLSRMRDLATESANSTLTSTDRSGISTEFNALRSEIDRIGQVTNFNGQNLLDGSASLTLQVGINGNSSNQISTTIPNLNSAHLGSATTLSNATVGSISGATNALAIVDSAIDSVSSAEAGVGSVLNRLQSAASNLQQTQLNLTEANSNIMNADVAAESANLAANNVRLQAGIAVLAQANQLPNSVLGLLNISRAS